MTKPALLLVGYGRFGAFAAGFLKRRFDVHVLERRRKLNLSPGLKKASIADLGRFSLVLFAIPAERLERFLTLYGRRIRPGAFVADTCAVKSEPMGWMRRLLPPDVSFAGLHPLFGPDGAARGLPGHRVAVCRGRSTAACHRRLLSTIKHYGLEPVETSRATHDRAMASTLFLTQITGTILNGTAEPEKLPFETPASGHLGAIRRIAGGNSPGLIGELIRYNPHCRMMLGRMRKRYQNEFRRLMKFSRTH